MTEARLYVGLIWAVVSIAIFALLYRLGGYTQKVWRRWGAGILWPLSCNGLAWFLHGWHWWYAVGVILSPTWLSLGYGGVRFADKLRHSLTYALAACLVGLCFLWGAWLLWLV